MAENLEELKAIVITVFGALTGLWGWLGWLIIGWIVCMILDWITGNMAAARSGTWSSRVAKDGIWHKVGMACIVAVAGGVDILLGVITDALPITIPLRYPGLICPIVLVWYIVTELGSIAENAIAMGANVPEWLRKVLAVAKNSVDNVMDDGDDPPEDAGDGGGDAGGIGGSD